MRVLVVSGFVAGSQFAHAINTVKMAQGFARLGHEVGIVCLRHVGERKSKGELAEIYGLTERLRWMTVPERLLGRAIGQHEKFAALALGHVLRFRPEFVYTRSYFAPRMTSRLGIPTAAETHAGVGETLAPFRRMLAATNRESFRAVVTISKTLADYYASLGAPREKIVVLPDAVDLAAFARPVDPGPSPYEGAGPHVVYTGHLYDYKGIPTVLEAAALMPEAQVHLVGGWDEDIERQRSRAGELGLRNVRFHGMKAQTELPPYLWHADALLLPPSAHHASARWTSPVKLGEYLAARRPVVATAIPALLDWLSKEEVELVEPDDAAALAAGVRRVLEERALSEARVERGAELAREFSYERRATSILKAAGMMEPGSGRA